MTCLDNITDSKEMSLSKLQETVKDWEIWHAAVHEVAKSWTSFSNWTTNQYERQSIYFTTQSPYSCYKASYVPFDSITQGARRTCTSNGFHLTVLFIFTKFDLLLYAENCKTLMKEIKDDTNTKIYHVLELKESMLLK